MRKRSILIFSIICFIVIFLFLIFNLLISPKKYKNYVVQYAEEYSLEIPLVYAIIKVESNFKKDATSPSNAMGLMQIIPSTAKWIAQELSLDYNAINIYDAKTNIKFGCFYLNYLFSKFNDIETVICAYNAGETIVKKWLNENGIIDKNKISYPETKNYLTKVKRYYQIYKNNEIGE